MRTADKVVTTVVLCLLLFAGFFYIEDYDLYQQTDSYDPIGGFSDFAERLSDKEWVVENFDSWAESSSPVLRSLYIYLCGVDLDLPAVIIYNRRRFHLATSIVSLSMWPVLVIVSAIRAKPKEAAKNG